jgi:hypothetical protein
VLFSNSTDATCSPFTRNQLSCAGDVQDLRSVRFRAFDDIISAHLLGQNAVDVFRLRRRRMAGRNFAQSLVLTAAQQDSKSLAPGAAISGGCAGGTLEFSEPLSNLRP